MKLIKAVFIIIRPLNLFITFISVLIAAYISAPGSGFDTVVWNTAVSVTLAFAAGYIINDIFDLEIDKINRPERILPSQILSVFQVKMLYIFFLILSLVFSISSGIKYFIFIIAVHLILFLYSLLLKKIPLLGNFTVAFITAVPLLLGGISAGNIEGGIIPAAFAMWINFIREIIKDMEDISGDRSKGVYTFPQSYGFKTTANLSAGLIVSLMIFTIFPFLYGLYNIEYFIIIMVLVNPFFVKTIKMIYEDLSLKNLGKISSFLKLNMLFGLIAILFGV